MSETGIAVIGLGYVGLPVALALAKKFENVHGFDISEPRVAELRQGKDVFPDADINVFLFLKPGESLEGKTYEVAATDEVKVGAPHVHIHRIPTGEKLPKGMAYPNKFAMKLEFGKAKDGKIPGKIYVCLPDEQKSYVAGTFAIDNPKGL